jgi:hypothetical protein
MPSVLSVVAVRGGVGIGSLLDIKLKPGHICGVCVWFIGRWLPGELK